LRAIAGVYEPVTGRVMADGEITPLFDTLPGNDPEDTGYENIITAGLMFGLTRERIEQMIPDIEQFSELGEYLALPARTYSTGMLTRLGFAFATAMDPGILLMDEGIGAGDARFAERAAKRMEEFIGRSRIVVVASHTVSFIKSICNKAALFQSGRLLAIGAVDDILAQYEVLVHQAPTPVSEIDAEPARAAG
jgi:ABC-type polysaccharide/polyol phosphate transport system ATPase subunit